MKFTKIRLIGLSTIDLPVADAESTDRYILKSAEGLGPPEIDVSIATTLHAGGVYQGRRPQQREPVLQIGLNPDYRTGQTASDLRNSLYGMLTPGHVDAVILQIMDGVDVVAHTKGYVKTLEIVPFAKDPEVQLVLSCLTPYFEAPEIIFVSPGDAAQPSIENVGTAPTGFYMEVNFTGPVSGWSLVDPAGKEMEFLYDFVVNDKLAVDTRPGSRGVWLTRDLVISNLIFALTANSIWPQLYGGDNIFSTSSQGFEWGEVYYYPQYWGI